ncbi:MULTISPECIES: HD-GYP domain-containing protein [Paenibacillus]|jgi:HD-GYP domain-containing protein (c-di-GMP phosphodiesterase class II)|uniref:HD-GYP domain-containing protein n=1 Tax=Paenibacillus TaxID=44249 RepID=UPI0004F6C832|nr:MULTISPECIES: HD-GYP domain-containing protein [unclassified Paenibacillus]AIQ32472.1 phosphohydrolase [Paenibacillus sp. FSL P4-0081]KHL94666.1 phosphohydrolase [Paenibacillus sp. IHB B 3415]OMF23331.1 phosphohydrolase [Paenibacillus sp. FSL H8-0259]
MDNYLGRTIKNDLINAYGVTVIPAKSKLNAEHLELIRKQRIDVLDIIFVDEQQAPSYRQMANSVVDSSKEMFESYRISRKIPLADIRKDVVPVIQEISRNPDIFALFSSVQGRDDYTYQHNVGVGVLSTLIGRWLHMSEAELSVLSLAATLHDIGKLKIPNEILNKPGKLTDEEFNLVKKHTIYGYEMLKETTGANSRITLAALQHHERNDGKGYPLGLKDEQIDSYSKIIAVADIFHAMSSKRPYHEAMPFHVIVDQMRRGSFGALDPHIVSVFLENIVKRTVGREVVLTDGRVGEIVYLNPHDIETPLIRINDEYIDLSKIKELNIREITI